MKRLPIKITIPTTELFDEEKEEFVYIKEKELVLEHSLVSLHKWEQKWHIPYLSSNKTAEQVLDYLRFMTITQNVDPDIYKYIPTDEAQKINAYIDNPMTATTFSNLEKEKQSKEILTAEIIYYWMIKLGIPVEFQKWHLNSLLTLIKVISLKEAPEKKMGAHDAARMQRDINNARRARLHSKG